ncbi:MAG: hypothetical protein IPK25_02215 [Saprospiraceae bacterium]|nr:hypothetical protein [Saprospiraceae bacterium]
MEGVWGFEGFQEAVVACLLQDVFMKRVLAMYDFNLMWAMLTFVKCSTIRWWWTGLTDN